MLKNLTTSLLIVLTAVACVKNPIKQADTSVKTAEDNSIAESSYDDATLFVDLSATYGSSFSFRKAVAGDNAREQGEQGALGACTTITLDTAGATRVITIDFGANNCVCYDGRTRRGKIIATYTGKYRQQNMVLNITFNNYFVNDNQVKGTHKVTNLGYNSAGHLVYKIEVNGQIIKANNGGTINWNSIREREWVDGANTPLNYLDDVYSIIGDATGTTAAGDAYTISITQPLVRAMSCRWFESGKLELTPQGSPTFTLDYGSTGCDVNATVSVLGTTFPVVLP